jgi:hypothetical protein
MATEVVYRARKEMRRHPVYTRAEADAMGLIVVEDWRDGERGQWVQTEDGHVVMVLRTGVLRRGTKWVRSPHGTFLETTGHMTTDKRNSRYTFTGRKANKEFKMSQRVAAWATAVAHGQPALKSYMDHFQSSSLRWAEQRVVFLLKRPEVIEHMKKELEPILEKLGVNPEFVIQGFVDIFKEGDSDNVRLKALTELAFLTGVKEEKKQDAPEGYFPIGEVFGSLQSGTSAVPLPSPGGDDGAPDLQELEAYDEP